MVFTVVLQMARDANLSQDELDRIPGTGYMGRLSKKDMKDYLSGKKDTTTKTQSQPASQTVTESKPAPASQAKPAQTSPAPSAPASQVISSAPDIGWQRRQGDGNGPCRQDYRRPYGYVEERIAPCDNCRGSGCHQTGSMALTQQGRRSGNGKASA